MCGVRALNNERLFIEDKWVGFGVEIYILIFDRLDDMMGLLL